MRAASLVVTKDRIYWLTNSDSHQDIIERNRLIEWNIHGEYNYV